MAYLGKILIVAGVILIIAGIVIYFSGNRLNWFGHLPGDIRIERENFSFYFPITTMVLLSAIITIVMWIFRKLN